MKPNPLAQDGLFCWKEGDSFLVACRYLDIMAQGPSLEEAFDRFCRSFTMDHLIRLENPGKFSPIPIPPEKVITEWEAKAAQYSIFELVKKKGLS